MKTPTYVPPEVLAAEAWEAIRRRPPEDPQQGFIDMVRAGFINARGEVTRLIGGSAEPEPDYQHWTPDDPSSANGTP